MTNGKEEQEAPKARPGAPERRQSAIGKAASTATRSVADVIRMAVFDMVLWFFDLVVHTFFREVRSRGTFNIPKKGPVIFVCAPHHNLFIDPVILMITSRKMSGRRVSLLTATKTYNTKLIGTISRLCDAIPVDRAQDKVKPYKGTIRVENFRNGNDNNVVIGEGTHFTKNAQVKGLIGLKNYLGNAKIQSIESDTKIILAKPFNVNFDDPSEKDEQIIEALTNGYPYVLAPHIDNKQTFQSVFRHLHKGRAVGIFPEGGSHDRPTLLPLKPGVALMALGTVAESSDPNSTVSIVPVGLNYFHANKFRSSVVIEYGKPIVITKKESAEYETNPRAVVNNLLQTISLRLEDVTVTCNDYDTLAVIQAARRLYAPTERDSTPLPMKVEMNRRLMKGYQQYADNPDVKELKEAVSEYNRTLMHLGLHDHQVEDLAGLNHLSVFVTFTNRLFSSFVYLLLSLPGTILFSPVFIVANRISKKKAKNALKSSVVKIKGDDVVATWKILVALGLAPMLYIFWAVIAVRILVRASLFPSIPKWAMFVECYLINILITYSALRTGEIGVDYVMSLPPLFYSLMSSRRDVAQIAKLKETRHELSRKVTDFCEKYGPSMFDDYDLFYRSYNSGDASSEYEYTSSHLAKAKLASDSSFSLSNLGEVAIFSQENDSDDPADDKTSDKTQENDHAAHDERSEEENAAEPQIRLRKTTREKSGSTDD